MLSLPETRRKQLRLSSRPRAHNAEFFAYAARFGVSLKTVRRVGLDCLEGCKDDSARRILLRAQTNDEAIMFENEENENALRAGEYGASLIAAERRRQIVEELYTLEDDAHEHTEQELARAALCYVYAAWTLAGGGAARDVRSSGKIAVLWPWAQGLWKPADTAERNLQKAGALIAAEIDRLEYARREQQKAEAEPKE